MKTTHRLIGLIALALVASHGFSSGAALADGYSSVGFSIGYNSPRYSGYYSYRGPAYRCRSYGYPAYGYAPPRTYYRSYRYPFGQRTPSYRTRGASYYRFGHRSRGYARPSHRRSHGHRGHRGSRGHRRR